MPSFRKMDTLTWMSWKKLSILCLNYSWLLSWTSCNISGVYKVPINLISFPTPLFSNLISFPWPPYSGGSGGPPPGNFFENGLLNRAFLGHFSAFWLMAGWVRTLSEPAPEPPLKFWIEYSFFFFLNKGNYFFVSSFFSIWDEIVNRRESKTSWCGRISKLWNGNGKM